MENELKQVIVVRTDIKMSKGKTAAQVAHASVEAVLNSKPQIISKWRTKGMKKIVLKVESETELIKIYINAKNKGLTTSLIKDAGRTELKPNTTTCCAIGPDETKKIDQITGTLKNL